jgi:hypothetical protein
MKASKIIFGSLFTICLLFFVSLKAQNDSVKFAGRPSFYLQAWGPEGLGAHFNIYLSNRMSLNAGLGFNIDAHIGTNFYFTKRNKSKGAFYAGTQFCSYRIFKFNFTGKERQLAIYFPVGYEYIGKKGFSFQIDIGPNIIQKNWGQYNSLPILASLKIGISPKK